MPVQNASATRPSPTLPTIPKSRVAAASVGVRALSLSASPARKTSVTTIPAAPKSTAVRTSPPWSRRNAMALPGSSNVVCAKPLSEKNRNSPARPTPARMPATPAARALTTAPPPRVSSTAIDIADLLNQSHTTIVSTTVAARGFIPVPVSGQDPEPGQAEARGRQHRCGADGDQRDGRVPPHELPAEPGAERGVDLAKLVRRLGVVVPAAGGAGDRLQRPLVHAADVLALHLDDGVALADPHGLDRHPCRGGACGGGDGVGAAVGHAVGEQDDDGRRAAGAGGGAGRRAQLLQGQRETVADRRRALGAAAVQRCL